MGNDTSVAVLRSMDMCMSGIAQAYVVEPSFEVTLAVHTRSPRIIPSVAKTVSTIPAGYGASIIREQDGYGDSSDGFAMLFPTARKRHQPRLVRNLERVAW